MSDQIKHECGIALLRLRKPPEYYFRKYGTLTYGLGKMYLMMEKQHNNCRDQIIHRAGEKIYLQGKIG